MDRVEELNDRLRSRYVATTPTFYFSPRPVPTKYTTMPILDEKLPATVPLQNEPAFDVSKHFLPGTSAPWSGKIEQIDTETHLIFPSKDYIPSSRSDLYVTPTAFKQNVTQTHPLLFTSVVSSNPGPSVKVPTKIFNNDTRIKNL